MEKKYFVIISLFAFFILSNCHKNNNTVRNNKNNIEIVQNYNFGYLTIPLRINDKKVVIALFDSGMPFRGVILFHREAGIEANLAYIDTSLIGGSGNDPGIVTFITDSIKITLNDSLLAHETILVMDVSRDSSKFDLDAIIGKLIFDEYLVEMDFDENVIKFHAHDSLKIEESWSEIPIINQGDGNAYINLDISFRGENKNPVLCAIDIGALSHNLKLTESPEMNLSPPPNSVESYLGSGLSSSLFGYLFRLNEVSLGNYTLKNVVTTMPYKGTSLGHGGNGNIGLRFLQRFNIIFDYPNDRIFVKPNKSFNNPFQYSMTGYCVKKMDDKSREIVQIFKNSPAEKAGLLKGDILLELNGKNIQEYNSNETYKIYRQEGKKINITIERDGKILNKELILSKIL